MDAATRKFPVTIQFDSAVLSENGAGLTPLGSRARIGWFLQKGDVQSASDRYRCFHFARALSPEFESRFFSSIDEVQAALANLDAVIIVKRIDRAVVDLVAIARTAGVPVFLDLCDDLIASNYTKNETGVNLVHFLGVAPLLAGITVASAEMADRLESYASGHGLSNLRVHVIPDIAETWDLFRATAKFQDGTAFPELPVPRQPVAGAPRKVLWFGNFGAAHSNFGIFSLKPWMKALAAVHRDYPLELVVVSNSAPVFRALMEGSDFPSRYVPWSPEAMYSELHSADVALLTTGDDEFCSIKSSNRVVQALAAGVPVISARNASVAEFEDVILAGRPETILRQVLGPSRDRVIAPRLAAAQHILERYTPDRLGGVWASLLRSAMEKTRSADGEREDGKLLFLFEPGDDARIAEKALAVALETPGLKYDLLFSTELLNLKPAFRRLPRLSRSLPRFFSGKLKGGRSLLRGYSGLVVARASAAESKGLVTVAREQGIRVLTGTEVVNGALADFARPAPAQTPFPPSKIVAGPYPERLDEDGSADWAFVVHGNARGWILDAICREIGSRQPGSWCVCYHPEPCVEARNLFFSHYMLLERYIDRHPDRIARSNVFVWYTHPREEDPVSVARLLLAFDKVTKVIFTSELNRQIWIERGLPLDKTAVILGAADPTMFQYHERGEGVVGLSSSFYERKNPDVLLDVVKRLPGREFLLLGRNWNRFALFEELQALPNFTYRTAPYREYPSLYERFDVFLSMSRLEGGPIPLIEAMMSNAVPVASRTGFAPELIRHGVNGFLFDLDASAEHIAALIEEAFALPGDIRASVVQYDWDNFSREVMKLAV